MAKFKIYSKDGQTVRYEGCPRYNGTYLKVSYLEFSSIASPTPIAWQVGDYVDYPRTGLRYTLRAIPAVKKTAKPGQTGDAFVYQNVQFMAQTQDLIVAPFIDLVPNDNGVHFSTRSAVSTFENAYGIAERIQACLDDLFPGVWEVKVYENLDEDFAKRISEAADFSIDGGTCLEACDRMYDTWGIGWTHYKDSSSGKDVLLFGRPNTRTSENTSAEFVFGPGNGLTAIKRAVANADEIGTRLRVFGSSRNMLPAYYRDLDIHNAESVDIQNLMIPTSKWGKTEGKPDARKAYLQAPDATVALLGLIPRTHYFDGSDGEEIYPSLEGVTVGDVRDAKEEMQDTSYVPTVEIYPSDSERVDEIKSVTNPEDDGYSGGSDGSKYKDTQIVSFAGVNRQQVLVSSNVRPEQYDDPVTVSWLIFNGVALKGDRALTVDSGLEGYIEDPNKIIEPYEKQLAGRLILSSGSGDNSNYASADIIFHKDGTYYRFTLPSVTLENPADYTDMSLRLEISAKATRSANTYFYVTLSGWDFLLGESTPVTNVFKLALKQIGFDIAQRASFTSDGLARVYMKDGMNAGRSFYVRTCSFDSLGDQWMLEMYRTEDESTGMRYPNSQYPIKPGDHFVLLDIAMPELYIGLASQRLYEKGTEMLADISRIKPYYEPDVDAIVMTEQGRVLREGMYMRLTDADVSAALMEYVLIDTLTISEGDAAIPIYKVSLREYKKKTFQETTNAAIDNISQKVSGAGSSGKPASVSQHYGALSGKPSIDGVTLDGAMRSYDDLGLLNKTHFDVVNVGTEESPIWALRTKYGLFSESFISARGSDPEAGSGGGGSGVDMESVWYALAQPTNEKINVSHLSANNVAQLLTAAGYKLTDTTYALATDAVAGLLKTGYAESGKNYAVKLDDTGRAYVNVPWEDKFNTYFGVDEDGNIYVKDNRGFWSNSFLSARGSDPEAGSGGGAGIDMTSVWYALGQPTGEKINASHIPELSISKITGLQGELDSKLSGITGEMVTEALGYTPYDGSQIGSASVKYAASAGKVAHALSIVAGDVTTVYDGSAEKSVTVPTAEQMALWNKVAALFAIDADGNVYVTGNRGFYGNSFISARGSDPEAGGSAGQGIDISAMWYALAAGTSEQINVTHIPNLSISKVTGLQAALDSKLEGITKGMVEAVLTGNIASHTHSQYAIASDYYNKTEIDSKLSSALTYKGSVQAYGDLPSSGNKKGDTWNVVEPYGDNYAWNGTGWDKLGGTYDFSIYALKADLTPINSSISTLQGYFTGGAANKVAHALTVNHDGGSSSASAKTYNGSASVTINIPTTLPASDVHDWAKQPDKPSYTFSEIGSKPSTLSGYGITDGVNAAEATGHLNASVSGHTLSIGVDSGYTIPADSKIALWDRICSLFDVDADGNVYVKDDRGFWSSSFISARGSDPGAGSGGGSGVDMESVWYALGQPTNEKINVSHIPALQQLSGTLTNAQLAYDSIAVAGVTVALGGSVTTKQIADALTFAGYKLTDTTYTLSSFGITASASELNKLDGLATTATELGYVHGVTSNIQTQLNAKQATITGAATSIVSSNLTANRALVSSGGGKVAVSAVSATELGYLDGVTSNIQTQLNSKAAVSALSAYLPLAGGTMTGLLNLKYSRAGLTMLDITNTAGGEVFLRMYSGSTYAGAFSTNHTSYGTAIFNARGGLYLGITNSGVPHFQGNTLLHSGNYTNYTVTKTGGGASGTWPISVSGSSNTLISTTNTAISNYVRYRQVSGSPSLVGSTAGGGAWGLPSTGPDAEYANGQILRLGWSPEYYTDIFTGPNDFGSAAGLQFRQIVNGKMSSRGWRTLLDTANYAGILDSRYLLKSSYTASDILAKLKTVDGSGSELDADLLDGTHKSGLLTALTSNTTTNLSLTVGGTEKTVADLYATYLGGQTLAGTRRGMSFLISAFSAAGWYRVYTSSSDNVSKESEVLLHIGRNYYSPQNEHYSFSICVGYNGDISITQLSGVMGGHLITKIRVVWANSQKFYIDIYSAASSYNNSYGVTGQGYGTFSAFTSGASIPDGYTAYEFTTVDGCKSDRGFSGTLSGNATSATKLATARSLWGQSFDGTQNVNGHICLDSQSHRIFFGTSGTTAYLSAGNGYFTINRATNTSYAANLLRINLSTGAVGINAVPSAMLHVGGTGYFSSNLEVAGTIHSSVGIWSSGYVSAKGQDTTSDARYKRDVAALPAQAALAVLMRLRPATWAWKDDGRRGAGFVAQEVLGVLPEAVREVGDGEDRHLALNYQMLHAYEVSMLQTHEARLTKLENEIKRIRHGS